MQLHNVLLFNKKDRSSVVAASLAAPKAKGTYVPTYTGGKTYFLVYLLLSSNGVTTKIRSNLDKTFY